MTKREEILEFALLMGRETKATADASGESDTFDGDTLTSVRQWEYPEPHAETMRWKVCLPDQATYWCAVNGKILFLKAIDSNTCIANTERALRLTHNVQSFCYVYVIWKPKNPNALKAWIKKWSARSASGTCS